MPLYVWLLLVSAAAALARDFESSSDYSYDDDSEEESNDVQGGDPVSIHYILWPGLIAVGIIGTLCCMCKWEERRGATRYIGASVGATSGPSPPVQTRHVGVNMRATAGLSCPVYPVTPGLKPLPQPESSQPPRSDHSSPPARADAESRPPPAYLDVTFMGPPPAYASVAPPSNPTSFSNPI